LNHGIDFRRGKFNFGIKYRVLQIKIIEKIIFNRIIKDPRTDQKFEMHNPFKVGITIGYNL
jgi:hypothetical protein